jgi:hypothetical protein
MKMSRLEPLKQESGSIYTVASLFENRPNRTKALTNFQQHSKVVKAGLRRHCDSILDLTGTAELGRQ